MTYYAVQVISFLCHLALLRWKLACFGSLLDAVGMKTISGIVDAEVDSRSPLNFTTYHYLLCHLPYISTCPIHLRSSDSSTPRVEVSMRLEGSQPMGYASLNETRFVNLTIAFHACKLTRFTLPATSSPIRY
jgi:hypothetical protein